MKKLLLAISLLISISIQLACTNAPKRDVSSSSEVQKFNQTGFYCEKTVVFKGQSLQTCHVNTAQDQKKTFYLMNLKGKETDIQYAHGYLLAEQIEDGAINEMLEQLRSVTQSNPKYAWALESIKNCYVNRMERSVSQDFLNVIKSLSQGYQDGMRAKNKTPKYNEQDFKEALLGIDLGNIVGGLAHQIGLNAATGVADLIGACGLKITEAGLRELFGNHHENNPTDDHKMGCMGVAISSNGTAQKKMIHGRNFDQTPLINTWAKHPVIYLIEEDGFNKYMGTGTAGLPFAAGISGMNEHGISATLHQLNTTKYDSLYRKSNAEVMPYLQQQVLKKAKSIDEAFALLQETKAFAAWTIFLVDAKTNEIASIEISPNRVVMARRNKNQFMTQSNHFIADSMQNQHYHDSYNNLLETISRLKVSEKKLADSFGTVDLKSTMNLLALHEDFFEGSRSFGRTPVKVSNIMATVAIPEDGTYWMTIGDVRPAAHSTYFGIKANWKNNQLIPVATTRADAFVEKPNLEASFDLYVEAYLLNNKSDYAGAIQKLKEAQALALKDGIDDFTYNYNIARLLHYTGKVDEAYVIMKKLWSKKDSNHVYQQALMSLYLGKMGESLSDIKSRWSHKQAVEYYTYATSIFKKLRADTHKGHARLSLKKKIKLAEKWSKKKKAKVPKLNFSVID